MSCALYFTVLSENTIRGRKRNERKKKERKKGISTPKSV